MQISRNLFTHVSESHFDSRQDFALCVKGLYYPFKTPVRKIVEWIELNLMLGAKKIFMYVITISEELTTILHQYTAKGLVRSICLQPKFLK